MKTSKCCKAIITHYNQKWDDGRCSKCGEHTPALNMCEMCDNFNGIRRKDNIYVCDECDKRYPQPKNNQDSSQGLRQRGG